MPMRIKPLISIAIILIIISSVSFTEASELTIRVLIYQGKEFSISGNSLEVSIKNGEQLFIKTQTG